MGMWFMCKYCGELFELESELQEHILREHMKLSENPKKEYYAEMWLIIKANNEDEVERILDFLVNIELPKCIDERIEKWSYEDETHSPIIEEVTEVDWKH